MACRILWQFSANGAMETNSIWHNGKLVPWGEARIHVLTHTLHYGGGAFEGLRFYKTDRGPAIFRLREHYDRLFYSADCLQMEIPFSKAQLHDATIELVAVNGLDQGYIRPITFFGYGKMGVNPQGAPIEVAIACWPGGAYLSDDAVDIKVSKYIRIHPATTVADAKLCGHYVNSILAVLELRGTRYHEALFLDYNGNVAEGPGENFFIIKKGKVYTPPLGTILAGITRSTVIELIKHLGLELIERNITLDEAFAADEAFFTGTAAEVTAIRSIDDRELKNGANGSITKQIKELYLDVVYGRRKEFDHYLTYVRER